MTIKKVVAASFFAVMALVLAGPAVAAGKGAEKGASKEVAQGRRTGDLNYKITFRANYKVFESSGSVFAVENGDADYFERGDLSSLIGEENGRPAYSIKPFQNKFVFKPSADSRDGSHVMLECHFELGGPVAAGGPGLHYGSLTFKSTVRLKLGKPMVLVDKPGSRIEVMVEIAE